MYGRSLATFLIGMKQETAYKAELMIGLLISLIWPLVLIAVWYAVFNASHATTISGYTISTLAAYYLISSGLVTLMNADLFNNLADSIGDGSVARYLTRPMHVLSQVFMIGFPDVIVSGLTRALPMIIIAFVVFALQVSPPMLLLFGLSVIIGFAVMQLFQLMISMSAVSFTQVYGIFWLFGSIAGLLGGSFIPLNMLPHWASGVVGLLPFQFAYYIPLSAINGTLSTTQVLSMMPLAIFWVAILCAVSFFQWKYTERHIDAAGV